MSRRSAADDAREVAHDISNLLTALIGAADAVLERSGIDPETRADVGQMREGARRGAALIQRLRSVAPDGAGPPRLIQVNETIRATSRLLAHRLGSGITLTMRLGDPDPIVRIDPAQLDRLLLNLVANARHAMPRGGTVTIETHRQVIDAPLKLEPDTIPPGDYVVISVADNGIGIPPDRLPAMFEPGVSTRLNSGGSGLGLPSVRDVVTRSSGFLEVKTAEGQGTRFSIWLPRSNDAMPQVATPSVGSASGTVLLVEDDAPVRQIAARVLRREGWTVLCAASAEEAMMVVKASPCDLVISDIALPGMDGVAFARHVRTLRPELPIILTSGYEQVATEDGYGATNFVFLTKPYGQEDLLAAVARVALR